MLFALKIRSLITVFSLAFAGALAALAALVAAPMGAGITPAAAQSSCQIDFQILTKKRMTEIAAINKAVKRNKGKLDPRTACPRLRKLAAAEREMLAYMKKNKAWCGIPDQPIEQMTKASKQTAVTAGRACKAAALMRKAIAQARRQQNSQSPALQRPKLPSGPL